MTCARKGAVPHRHGVQRHAEGTGLPPDRGGRTGATTIWRRGGGHDRYEASASVTCHDSRGHRVGVSDSRTLDIHRRLPTRRSCFLGVADVPRPMKFVKPPAARPRAYLGGVRCQGEYLWRWQREKPSSLAAPSASVGNGNYLTRVICSMTHAVSETRNTMTAARVSRHRRWLRAKASSGVIVKRPFSLSARPRELLTGLRPTCCPTVLPGRVWMTHGPPPIHRF